MLIPIDGEDAVTIIVLETKGDAQRLEVDAVPRHVICQNLVVPVVPVKMVGNSGLKEIVSLIILNHHSEFFRV